MFVLALLEIVAKMKKHHCYYVSIVAWLFLHETLKKPNHKMNTKKLHASIAATNDGDVISDSMATISDDSISELENGGECKPLLGSHDPRKMLVF